MIEQQTELVPVTGDPTETNPENKDIYDGSVVPAQKIISGARKEFLRIRIQFAMMRIIFREYRNPFRCIKILRTLNKYRRKLFGARPINKIIQVDGKYYWNLYTPGFRTKTFDDFVLGEASRILPTNKTCNRFRNIFIAVTKRCPYHCQHCFEWDSLNGREKLTLSDINCIVRKFQEKGTSQVQFTGGEPMLRVNDILEVLKSAKAGTEFWVLTSGYNLTLENASKLKDAGLTGIVISLDHYSAVMHNNFRGSPKSFDWVQLGVRNTIASNLLTALSICVTKSFISDASLMEYAELAKKMGVSFIQIIEPRAVGHYNGKDVLLKIEEEKMLEEFYFKMNYDRKYKHYPVIVYPGLHQRTLGCFSSGNRNLYIDTDGDIHACPFCQAKTGSALTGNIDNAIEKLRAVGCHKFKNAEI